MGYDPLTETEMNELVLLAKGRVPHRWELFWMTRRARKRAQPKKVEARNG